LIVFEMSDEDIFLFVTMILIATLMIGIGIQFYRGKWLEYITLIDPDNYDCNSLSKISSSMCFSIAITFFIFTIAIILRKTKDFSIIALITLMVVLFFGYLSIFYLAKRKNTT